MPIDSKTGINTDGGANLLGLAGSMDYFRELFPHGPTNTLDTLKGIEDIRSSQARTKSLEGELSLRARSQALEERKFSAEEALIPLRIQSQQIQNNMNKIALSQGQLGLDRAEKAQGQLLRQINETPAAEAELATILAKNDPAEIQTGLDNLYKSKPWVQFDQGMQQHILAAKGKVQAGDYYAQKEQDISDAKKFGLPISSIIGEPNHQQLVDYRKQLVEAQARAAYTQANGPPAAGASSPWAPGMAPDEFDKKWAQWTKNPNAFDANGNMNPGLGLTVTQQLNQWAGQVAAKTGKSAGALFKWSPKDGVQIESPQMARGAASQININAARTMMNDATRGYNEAQKAFQKAKADDDLEGQSNAQQEMLMYKSQHDDARAQMADQGAAPTYTPTAPPAPNKEPYFNLKSSPTKAVPSAAPAPQETPRPTAGATGTWETDPNAQTSFVHPLDPTASIGPDELVPDQSHSTDLAYSNNFDDLFNV